MFDAEAVAIDKDSAKLLPFQELSRRKRKDVKVEDIKVRVCLFAFDLLYLNGEVRGAISPAWLHPLTICFYLRWNKLCCARFAPYAIAAATAEGLI